MKPKYFLLIIIFTLPYWLNAQYEAKSGYKVVNKFDSVYLTNLPTIQLPDQYRSRDLPDIVDNSTSPYLRPIFSQDGASCGQAASMGYHFTYEINHARNAPAVLPVNQYPTHYTWNFMNPDGALIGTGVSYFHSFEIVRANGCPNLVDYGGMSRGDSTKWMTGYEKYYNGMFNRIEGLYQLDLSNEEGLNTLKNWVYDHLDGSEYGGVANYYAGIIGTQALPAGTPEAGKHVIPLWGSVATHAMTIIGYNDSIRWDYNNDAMYTNHIDITGDGIVDMKDWEIGGFKFVNSYGGDWADHGFCYVMYKTFAEYYGHGGVWNNCVHLIKTMPDYEPKLTMKVVLTHTSREKIKITAGIAEDPSADYPAYTMDFPIFNYQGGNFFMQGYGHEESKKTIEIGLDITPLLSYLDPGSPAKFFLQVSEKDPLNEHEGKINFYSVISYVDAVNETIYPQADIPINDNFITILGIEKAVNFNKLSISDTILPAASENQLYNYQFHADGGEPPYKWELLTAFSQSSLSGDFPEVTEEDLVYGLSEYGMVGKKLDFTFPFYGESYDSIFVHAMGYILFQEETFPWPYIKDVGLLLSSIRTVAPLMNIELLPIVELGKGMWYEGNENYATFRWKLAEIEDPYRSDYNFAVTLYPDGTIDFHYGDMIFVEPVSWTAGVSVGDKYNHTTTASSQTREIITNQNTRLHHSTIPEGIILSEDGLLEGTPASLEHIYDLMVGVTDQQNIFDRKSFQFSSGIFVHHNIKAGDDQVISRGEEVFVDVTIHNATTDTLFNTDAVLILEDLYFTLTDAQEQFGTIHPGEEVTIENSFSLVVSEEVPDKYSAYLQMEIQDGALLKSRSFTLEATAPLLALGNIIIDDGNNGILHPGETSDMIINVNNGGHAPSYHVTGELTSDDPFISVNESNILYYGTILERSNNEQRIEISANPNTPNGYFTWMQFELVDSTGSFVSDSFRIIIGNKPVLIIDLDENQSSGPELQKAMWENNIEPDYRTYLPWWDLYKYDGIFICLGIFPRDYHLTAVEGADLANYLDNGGNIYMEAGAAWYNAQQTTVHQYFNIEGSYAGWPNGVETIEGNVSTFAEGLLFAYNGENTKMDNLEPIEPAYKLMNDIPTGLSFSIAHESFNYKTIGNSYEFGGLMDTIIPSTKKELAKRYLHFFGIQTEGLAANFMANTNEIDPGDEIQFSDISSKSVIEWNWSFPGGYPETSDVQNPSVTYDTKGIYNVTLTVSDGNSSNTLTKTGYIFVGEEAGVDENNPISDQLFIYPNPAKNQIYIRLKNPDKGEYTISVLNSLGMLVHQKAYPISSGIEVIQIQTIDLPSGIYYVNAADSRNAFTQKFVILR